VDRIYCTEEWGARGEDMEIAVPKMREGDHSHKNSGSTGSRDGVEGRGSTIDKNVVRRGYTRAV
jgi:hypothetical protein